MKVKDKMLLKRLKSLYEVESVKYDVLSKTFLYNFPNEEEKSMTFDSLLNIMDKSNEIYGILDSLRSSYFPRRLKEVIEAFYEIHELKEPQKLLIGEKGFEIDINGKIHYIEYSDDFSIFLNEFAKLYDIEYDEVKIEPHIEDYKGHYHKNN